MIRLEEFSTREAILLGETVARQVGVEYRGAAAEGFCAHVSRNAQAISTTVKTAARMAMRIVAFLPADRAVPESHER